MSLATMSGYRLFHSRAPTTANLRTPTVEHCDWMTSSWSVSVDDVVWTTCQTNDS